MKQGEPRRCNEMLESSEDMRAGRVMRTWHISVDEVPRPEIREQRSAVNCIGRWRTQNEYVTSLRKIT